jgi:hypothetical protein
MGKPNPIPARLQAWVDARQRHRISHAYVQMARELGLNPAKLEKLDNRQQEPWKAPLPQFIEHLYAKQFGREHRIERSARLSSSQSTVESASE